MASSLGSRQLSERNWPAVGFDVVSLRGEGWTERPLRQFVLKIQGRCNLSCTYCYVYELADQSWREKPRIISPSTLSQAALRIAEHAAEHRLPVVEVIFHGGEPLLCGESFIRSAVALLRDARPGWRSDFPCRLQTNGTLLTQRSMLAMLHESRISRVGVSVDGTAQERMTPSEDTRTGAAAIISSAPHCVGSQKSGYSPYLLAGILCTVDISSDPVETYRTLRACATASGFPTPACELVHFCPRGSFPQLRYGGRVASRQYSIGGMVSARRRLALGCSKRSFTCC